MKVNKIITNPKFMYNDAFDNFLKNQPARFETMGRTIHEGRNTVKIFAPPECNLNIDIAVKKYKVPNPIQRLHYTLSCNTKCLRAYVNGLTTEIDKLKAIKALHSIHYRRKKKFLHGLKNFVLH